MPDSVVRERFWWRAAALVLLVILLAAWPLQFVLDFLRFHNLLRLSMLAVFLVVAFALVLWLVRSRAGWREWATLAAGAAGYAAVAQRLPIVQERLHLIEFGGLALLFAAAFSARLEGKGMAPARASRRSALPAFAAAAGAGLLDELLQGLLPNRHFDARDLALNALAAALALIAAAALGVARRRDRSSIPGAAAVNGD